MKANSKATSASYEVGRGRPPIETRFRKGQSGNPRGRPRKHLPMNQSLDDLVLNEALRTVTIREGDKSIQLPAAAAVLRSQFALAVRGNGVAQRAFLSRLEALQEKRAAANHLWLEQAIEYKIDASKEIKRREALGITDMSDIHPHPDRILIDEYSARVYLCDDIFPIDAAVIQGLKLKNAKTPSPRARNRT